MKFRFSILLIMALGCCRGAAAAPGQFPSPDAATVTPLLVVDTTRSGEPEEPLPGSLLLPQGSEPGKDPEKKQCMTVCARWGEECMLINKGAGGMERRCRRTCKQFAEECF